MSVPERRCKTSPVSLAHSDALGVFVSIEKDYLLLLICVACVYRRCDSSERTFLKNASQSVNSETLPGVEPNR